MEPVRGGRLYFWLVVVAKMGGRVVPPDPVSAIEFTRTALQNGSFIDDEATDE
jgi:hypothetical protein